jgi:CheY-like chemotaxis protein
MNDPGHLVPTLGGDLTTLLAVDDSKTMRKVLEITFAGESFETRISANTNDAFAQLAERPISVALVDVTLGEQSGYDVCKRLKSEYPAVKVLLLSSKQSPYDAARGVSSGADDHLDKPFDTQVLIDKVRALLTRAAAQPAPQPAVQPVAQVTLAPAPDKPTAAAAFPVHTSDSKIPTAMPEAPTEELLDDEGPLLIPIDEDEAAAPSPETIAPVAPIAAKAPEPVPDPAPAVARTVLIHNKPADLTLPVKSGNGSAAFAPLESKLSALGLTEDQVSAVLALSREVVEAAVWEVVPTLAETLIKEEIRRLTQ